MPRSAVTGFVSEPRCAWAAPPRAGTVTRPWGRVHGGQQPMESRKPLTRTAVSTTGGRAQGRQTVLALLAAEAPAAVP